MVRLWKCVEKREKEVGSEYWVVSRDYYGMRIARVRLWRR